MAERNVPPVLEAAIARWQQAGIITGQQADAMRDLESRRTPSPAPTEPAGEAGVSPSALIISIGGFLVLVASVVFVALGWEGMGRAQQLLWGVLAVVVPWGAAFYLRRTRHNLALHAGSMLVAIGTLSLMLLGYTLFRAIGVWPDSWHFRDPDAAAKQLRTDQLMLVLQGVTAIVAAIFAFRLNIPSLLLITWVFGAFAWSTGVDLLDSRQGLDDPAFWRIALFGVLLVVAGLAANRTGWRLHAFWLFFCGLTITFMFFGADVIGNVLGLSGLTFLALAIIAIALSMWTDYRIFLVYGALGLYVWVSALIVDTFGGSQPVAFALILLGAAIVIAGLLWQRWNQRGNARQDGDTAPAL
jgi:uncharacterized protein (DUF486 family)